MAKKLVRKISVGLTLLCLSLYASPSCAQTRTNTVKGILLNSNNTPAAFKQLSLKGSNAFNRATFTDGDGVFVFATIDTGKFTLLVYTDKDSVIVKTFLMEGENKTHDLGNLEIPHNTHNLEEIVITAKKNLISAEIDRKVYKVEDDVMSQTGSVSDVLKNVPSVQVDVEGNVSLRGSADVLILINGKVSPLMGKSKAEVLQSLPANSIERIEIMTNPSARYRPDGSTGIINIVTRKDTKAGINGSLTANAGNYDRYNSSFLLNYHPEKLNILANYGFRKDYRIRYSQIERSYLDSFHIDRVYREHNTANAVPYSHTASLGLEYELIDNITLEGSLEYFYRKFDLRTVSERATYGDNTRVIEQFNRLRSNPEYERQISGAGSLKYAFEKEDHELSIEWNIADTKEAENNRFTNTYFIPNTGTTYDNLFIGVIEKERQVIADYANPLTDDSKLQIGYDGLFQQIRQDFKSEYFNMSDNSFVPDTSRSNLFHYRGSIHAVYATYEKAWDKFSFTAGVRSEWTLLNSNQITAGIINNSSYFKLYPTIHLACQLSEKQELQINYSKRVNRPDGDDLNPFPEYQDPRNLFAGNPGLLPEIIHSIELGYKWRGNNLSFVPALYYRLKNDGFSSVSRPLNDSVILTTYENVARDQAAGLELVVTGNAGKWLNGNLTANIFYNTINAANLGNINNRSVFSMALNSVVTFTIRKNIILQVSGNYQSAKLTVQGQYKPAFILNSGLRKDFFQKKLSVLFTVSDIFSSNRRMGFLETPDFVQHTVNRRDGFVWYLGINYKFGMTTKGKDQKLQFDNTL